MDIVNIKTIHGPNIYHHRPIIIMTIDLQQWTETPSSDIPRFNDSLLKILPGLKTHTCSTGTIGGFCKRLNRGTYMAHIIEHVALELSVLSGIECSFGKARYADKPRHYNVIVRFQNEEGMKLCLRSALDIVERLLARKKINLETYISEIKQIVEETKIGPSTEAILKAAAKRNIPYRKLNESLYELGYGKNIRRIQTAVSTNTSLISADIAQDKELTKSILSRSLIPTCDGISLPASSSQFTVYSKIRSLSFPLVVKPSDGNHGNGVSLNLKNQKEVYTAFKYAKNFSDEILIEEMADGLDYRLLVVNYKLIAAAERTPAFVTGNGTLTIKELIELTNQDPQRKEGHSGYLTKIEIDQLLLECLKKKGFNLNSIPEKGKHVTLKETANLSAGGTAKDVTTSVHPEIKMLAERTARVIGLDICGIDLIHNDIKKGINESTKVIEVNAGPGLRMHLSPQEGTPQNVGDYIVDMLYPNPEQSRIPIVSVTGTNGKTTTVRLLEKICSYSGACTGMTCSDGIWVDQQRVFEGDTTGPRSSELILTDKAVEFAILEVARGGLMRGGLAYDESDGAIITNIQPDHFGQDGIETVEDIMRVKSLVLERVKENGFIVANADDPLVLEMLNHSRVKSIRRNLILFSLRPDNRTLKEHQSKKGTCYWIDQNEIYSFRNGRTEYLGNVENIPLTLRGTVKFQIANALASLAAGVAMGFSTEHALRAIENFNSNKDNVGRMNIFKVDDKCVILDYAHNPQAIHALCETLDNYTGFEATAVFGLPGDRTDDLIIQATQNVTEKFSDIIVREDEDLRGRNPGELANLIEKELIASPAVKSCQKILDSREALKKALEDPHRKDHKLIVFFYETMDHAVETLKEFNPIAIDHIPFPLKSEVERKDWVSSNLKAVENANTI